MKALFKIDDTLTNKISYYHLLFFLITLPLDRFYCEVILASFAIHTLIHVNKMRLKEVFNKEVLILQSVYLVTLFGTFYTANMPQAISDWGRQLAIFILPLMLYLNELNLKKYQHHLLLIFSGTFTVTVLYLYYNALHIIHYHHLPISFLFSPFFINHNFCKPLDVHATFLSLYIALSLTYFLMLLFQVTSVKQKIIYSLCSLLLLGGLIQLGSKSVLISVLLIANFILPIYYLSKKQRLQFMVATTCLTLLLIVSILKVDSFKNRYVTNFKSDLVSDATGLEVADSRMERWKVALDLIVASPVIGYGAGDEVDQLKERFFEHKLYNSFLFHLNAHNQYLSFLIKEGIVGLLVYLYVLSYGFYRAVKSKDILFVSFLILIAIVSLSESFLDANKGVFFYGFFFSFFIFRQTRQSKNHLL